MTPADTSTPEVQAGLRNVQSVVPLASGDAVSIEAVPGRMFDMLARAQVQLGTTTGAKIPLSRHGEGTQSLAVLMLFSAFLEAQENGAAVLALEEPEAHLHPSAIRALWTLVRDFAGQKLISTHSGELLADQQGQGALLFARCWLLVEGQTEAWVYPAAARALGLNLHREGIRVVEFSQSDAAMLAKVANALGIRWYLVGDDDGKRVKEEPRLKRNLDGADAADRFVFPYENIEVYLLRNGYESVYSPHMPQQNLRKLTKQPGDPGYWREYAAYFPGRAKTRAAAEVAIEMENRGSAGVPSEIRGVLARVVSLARGESP